MKDKIFDDIQEYNFGDNVITSRMSGNAIKINYFSIDGLLHFGMRISLLLNKIGCFNHIIIRIKQEKFVYECVNLEEM